MPESAQSFVATLVRTIFAQPDADSTRTQHARVIAELASQEGPGSAELLNEVSADPFAFVDLPREHRKQIWSDNPQERLDRETRRRTAVVGIFPRTPLAGLGPYRGSS